MFDNYSENQYISETNSFIRRVYFWMTFALIITAWMAYYTVHSVFLMSILAKFYIPLMFVQLWIVIWITFLLPKISSTVATFLFLLYALLTWLTFWVLFAVYSMSSIFLAFWITWWLFLFMSFYWYFTKSDLTSMWSLLIMWLVWLILASLVNLFMNNDTLSYILSYLWVLIFTWLIAYDTQKLKELSMISLENEDGSKLAVMWALSLYLDFINLFIYILRIVWNRD